jgi:hypothetical protein
MRLHTLASVGLASLLLALGFVGSAQAQERFKPVGSLTYEPEPAGPEKGVFTIRQEDRRIRAMRILAEDGSADVRSLKVNYADGDSEVVKVRQVLQEGQRTAVFELEEVRPIRSVEVTYIPKGNVTLVLLSDGRRAEPPPPPPQQTAEWVELGCQKVGLLGDRDSIAVNSPDKFKSIRLRSQNYDIEMAELSIRYSNGGRDTYQVRQVIPAGGRIGPIALRGDARRISQLDFLYRARTIGPFKTKLCVDALRVSEDDDDN